MGPEGSILKAEVAPGGPGDLLGGKGEEGRSFLDSFPGTVEPSDAGEAGGWGRSGSPEKPAAFFAKGRETKKYNSGFNAWVAPTLAQNR